ncbi:hypothetical protein ACFDTO_28635 [Microbacteriaceae bacterium 4G12]
MKVRKVAPTSGPLDKRNILLAAVAWVAGRIGSGSGGTVGKSAVKGRRRAATGGRTKAAPKTRNSPAAKSTGSATVTALEKKRAKAEKARREARAKSAAMPPKIVAKQSRKAAKFTKKSRTGK